MNTITTKNLLDLDYNQEKFKENYQGFVVGFNHGPMVKGPVKEQKAQEILKELTTKAQAQTSAVSFNPEKLKQDLKGGSCSSIALRVAKTALNLLKTDSDKQKLIQILKEGVSKIGDKKPDRETIRTIQAVFNTITVKRDVEVSDICQHKIKALAAYYDIKVTSSTEELKIEEDSTCQEKFTEAIGSLGEGVYLVRVLVKKDNRKLEKQGHSTVYVKLANGQALYFDTQLGLYDLKPDDQKAHLIYQACYSAKKKFQIDSCKFHKLSL